MMLFFYPYCFVVFISLLCGPLGSLMLWRRMTFFAETLAHSTLISYFLHMALGWPLMACMMIVVLSYALVLECLQYQRQDYGSVIPLLSYGMTGLTLLMTEKYIKKPALVYKVFLGDLLLTDAQDCYSLFALIILVHLFLKKYYRPLLLMLFSPELAKLRYKNLSLMSILLNVFLGLSVTLMVQSVGLLLAMALFTIPALIAASYTEHPWQMMRDASLWSCLASTLGFVLSVKYQMATGPCIIVTLMFFYGAVRSVLALKIFFSAPAKAL